MWDWSSRLEVDLRMAQNGAAGAAGFPPGGIDLSALQNVLNVSGLAAILACRSCFGT